MELLPQGSLRRRVFEWCDRWLCHFLTGQTVTCSTYLGDRIKDGSASWYQTFLASAVDALVFEYGHCLKNAGKI